MNTAEQAERLLQAWTIADRTSLNQALKVAYNSCQTAHPISQFERERQEVLQSIVEHLRCLNNSDAHLALESCGAFTLLRHLQVWTIPIPRPLNGVP